MGKSCRRYIYYRYPARQDNGSIYIETKFSKTTNLQCLAREEFPGRGFSWGAINAEKRGLEIFWGKCLKRNLDD